MGVPVTGAETAHASPCDTEGMMPCTHLHDYCHKWVQHAVVPTLQQKTSGVPVQGKRLLVLKDPCGRLSALG